KKAQREQRERERLRAAEIERQREAARQRYRQDRARIRRFERLREACSDHENLQAFLKQLRGSIGTVEPETEVARWLEWANEYVNQLDPLERFRNPAASLRLYHGTTNRTAEKISRQG